MTRKDKLATNVLKMQELHGKRHFDILPETYILPDEYSDFYAHFMALSQESPFKNVWIIKPASASRGRGIYITDNINEIDPDEDCVV